MNISHKDLNLLLVFHVLYQECNVSLAAQRMALSQPAISHKLNKLRHDFDDPLFVRAARGLTPTPRAHELAAQLAPLITALENFYTRSDQRAFLQKTTRIHLFTTDYIEQTLLPHLLPILRAQAPNLTLITHNTRGELPRDELADGRCDLAIAGFYHELPDTFYQQRLLSEDFVVLASRDHPALHNGLDLATFLACEHVLTTLTGDLNGIVDRTLAAIGQQRRIVAGLASFLAPARLISGSPWLLTCLRSLAEHACQLDASLTFHPLPFAVAPIEVMQIWHQRTDQDPLRRWLRQEIQRVAQQIGTPYKV